MTIDLAVQKVSSETCIPDNACFRKWAAAALPAGKASELTIRIVDQAESAALNQRYRDKPGATNVLSFAAEIPPELGLPLLGDLVICAPLVRQEAAQCGKDLNAHWAHLVIHGVLHLQGLDHVTDEQAREMESLEVALLQRLGFPDPYR